MKLTRKDLFIRFKMIYYQDLLTILKRIDVNDFIVNYLSFDIWYTNSKNDLTEEWNEITSNIL